MCMDLLIDSLISGCVSRFRAELWASCFVIYSIFHISFPDRLLDDAAATILCG